MKVSIITVCFNSERHLKCAIESVLSQDYDDVEYIIVDGKSSDGTLAIIREYADKNEFIKWVSEPDTGIYDAMNKGIRLATGDIVGILNSDDMYANTEVLSDVVEKFASAKTQCVFADVRFVRESDTTKTIRYYSSANFTPKKFKYGFMPAHPTFFTYRSNFARYGFYQIDYHIAADYELLIRFLHTNGLSYEYINKPLIIMRLGGVSTKSFRSNVLLNKEIVRGCAENGIKTNMAILSLKYFKKVRELIVTRNE